MENNKFHILIVDDDNRIRDLLKDYLIENNYIVSTAENANQAKERLEFLKFDIIILDVMMPGQNGYELTKELKKKIKVPLMISATITDLSGRTLSGQTLEAFYNSIIHSNPLSVGLNCALGPKELESHLIELDRISEFFVSIHPNAGLPNAFGGYDETPESMAKFVKKWGENCYINIVGGCCGATPEHINLKKKVTEKLKPRKRLQKVKHMRLSGLEAFNY